AYATLDEELEQIADLRREALRALAPLRVALELSAILLHHRTAACCVHDDVLHASRLERVDIAAREIVRIGQRARVCVQCTATPLRADVHDIAPVRAQHAHGRVVHTAEEAVLDTAAQHSYTQPFACGDVACCRHRAHAGAGRRFTCARVRLRKL